MRSEVVMPSPHGHHRPNANTRPYGALVKRSCPERRPPERSAMSRTSGGAVAILFGSHSFGISLAAVERTVASSSVMNVDDTHKSRWSQLQPRCGQLGL